MRHAPPPETPAAGTTDERKVAATITVSVEVRTSESTRTVRVSAPSIRRPLELAGSGPPGTEARVLFPIDPNELFAGPNDAPQILHAPALAGAA